RPADGPLRGGGAHALGARPPGTQAADRGAPMIPLPPTDAPGADERLTRLLDEYLAALRAGEPPDPDALLARHPDLAGPLRRCLPSLDYPRAGAADARGPALEALGDFRLLREVGRGGMGVVYEAVQVSLGRRVALKVLPLAAALDPRQLQRFRTEA